MTSCSGGLINVKMMLWSRWFRHSVFGQVHAKTREMLSISNKCFIFSRSSKNWLRDFGGWVVPGFVCAVVRNRSPPAEAIRNERDFRRQGKQASGNVKSEFPTPGKDNWSWKVGHVRTSLKDCNFKWWKLIIFCQFIMVNFTNLSPHLPRKPLSCSPNPSIGACVTLSYDKIIFSARAIASSWCSHKSTCF